MERIINKWDVVPVRNRGRTKRVVFRGVGVEGRSILERREKYTCALRARGVKLYISFFY
jgi:hypothetical protein